MSLGQRRQACSPEFGFADLMALCKELVVKSAACAVADAHTLPSVLACHGPGGLDVVTGIAFADDHAEEVGMALLDYVVSREASGAAVVVHGVIVEQDDGAELFAVDTAGKAPLPGGRETAILWARDGTVREEVRFAPVGRVDQRILIGGFVERDRYLSAPGTDRAPSPEHGPWPPLLYVAAGLATVEAGGHDLAYVHWLLEGNDARALPRNSLCPCGSGRKHKHCHADNPFPAL